MPAQLAVSYPSWARCLRANKWLKRTPPSVTPPAGKDSRRRATLRLRRLATPLGGQGALHD